MREIAEKLVVSVATSRAFYRRLFLRNPVLLTGDFLKGIMFLSLATMAKG